MFGIEQIFFLYFAFDSENDGGASEKPSRFRNACRFLARSAAGCVNRMKKQGKYFTSKDGYGIIFSGSIFARWGKACPTEGEKTACRMS